MTLRGHSTFRAGSWARLEARLVPRLASGAQAAAAVVLEDSQTRVPVRTSELRDSGHTKTRWMSYHVQSFVIYSAMHAAFVEFGTGLKGMGTYPYTLPSVGVPITGSWIYDYKHQNWVGMVSQPYLRPALDTARPAALDIFRKICTAQ